MKALNVASVLLVAGCIGVVASPHAQNAAHGAQVFESCAPCHATAAGFRYSKAMKSANIVWNEKWLDAYLAAPQEAVPGNVMPFSGIEDVRERKDLIAYLETLK